MPKEELWNRDSPVWSRYYSSPGGVELGKEAESDLQQVSDGTTVSSTSRVVVVVAAAAAAAALQFCFDCRCFRSRCSC